MSGSDDATAGPSLGEADGQQQQLVGSRPGEAPYALQAPPHLSLAVEALQAPPHLVLAVEAVSPASSVTHPDAQQQKQQQQAKQYILRYEYSNNNSRLLFLTLLFVTLCSLAAMGAEGIEGYRALRVSGNQHDVPVTSRWGLGYRGGQTAGVEGTGARV